LKHENQTLMKKFQSRSAEKILIKVRLQKVNHVYTNPKRRLTTERVIQPTRFNQGLLKKFQSRSAENFLIIVWLKKENQSLIDPDHVFDRDPDRD
jgi:hypothetical protein